MKTLDWHGCYSGGWGQEIVPEAFSHPAKYARGLIRRIYEHALGRGYFREGDTIIDPFSGVGLGALNALANGLNFIGSELERHFVDMGAGCECTGINKADWVMAVNRWKRFGYMDDRHWCPRCVSEAELIIGRQPPALPGMGRQFASYQRNSGKIPFTEPHHYTGNLELFAPYAKNGARAVILQGDSRQLCDVLAGAVARGLVSSPPYSSGTVHGDDSAPSRMKRKLAPKGKWGAMGNTMMADAYSPNPANLGNLPAGDRALVSSPPWMGSQQVDDRKAPVLIHGSSWKKRQGSITPGSSPGQLAAMPEGVGLVSSPPWEQSNACEDPKYHKDRHTAGGPLYGDYGNSDGQLGQESGETFWAAAKTIVSQCYQVLGPGSVAIWVVKAFVRSGMIVDFPGQWQALCEACGFETIEIIRAWLVENRGAQFALNGDLIKREIHRKSFFRRLAEKRGSPAIDYEVVLITQRGY